MKFNPKIPTTTFILLYVLRPFDIVCPLRCGACRGPTYATGNNENLKQDHHFSAIPSAVRLQHKKSNIFSSALIW
jgi:hypothetical protein